MIQRTSILAASLAGVCLTGTTLAGVTLGPTPYLSAADSPFNGMSGWVLEDFEDAELNILGASANLGGVIGPSGVTDSVDGDDGAIDGSGSGGHSYFYSPGANGISFTFDAALIGEAPVAAGIVWTDGGGEVTFEAYDTNDMLIGALTATHADGSFGGTTGEDRFYGVEHAAGIGRIYIRNAAGGIEVDHLQYVVPTPGTAALVTGSALLTVGRRR